LKKCASLALKVYCLSGAVMLFGGVVGILIGLLTGVVTLVVLYPILSIKGYQPSGKRLVTITAQLLALPAFWFGGPWLSTTLLNLVDLNVFLAPYVLTLAFTYIIVVLYPLVQWVRWLGLLMGRNGYAH
jgi:hypothetical protein